MIQLQAVDKYFGKKQVLKNINLTIKPGEVVGLLGPNGAGKTTSLKIITGILPASKGSVNINGYDPLIDYQVRKSIGFLPENNPLYEDMTVAEWLYFWAKIKSAPEIGQKQVITAVKQTSLEKVFYQPINSLSKGYRQRVGLAQAILSQPDILILDEPTEGLDPIQRGEIHQLIRQLGKKKTIIISSHVLAEISKICNRVIIIHQGKIVADGPIKQLEENLAGMQTIQVQIKGKQVLSNLKKLPDVIQVEKQTSGQPARYIIQSRSKKDLRPMIFQLAVDKKWILYELQRQAADLEQIFMQVTR